MHKHSLDMGVEYRIWGPDSSLPQESGVLGTLGNPPRSALFTSHFGPISVALDRPRADRDRGPLHHRRLRPWLHRFGNMSQRAASRLQAGQWIAGQKRGGGKYLPPDMPCPAGYLHTWTWDCRCQAYAGMPPSCLRSAAGTEQKGPAERRSGRPVTSRRRRRWQAIRSITRRSRCLMPIRFELRGIFTYQGINHSRTTLTVFYAYLFLGALAGNRELASRNGCSPKEVPGSFKGWLEEPVFRYQIP